MPSSSQHGETPALLEGAGSSSPHYVHPLGDPNRTREMSPYKDMSLMDPAGTPEEFWSGAYPNWTADRRAHLATLSIAELRLHRHVLSTPSLIRGKYVQSLAVFPVVAACAHQALGSAFGVPVPSWINLALCVPAVGLGWLASTRYDRRIRRARWAQARRAGITDLPDTPEHFRG